jgi:hypothetical protein
MVLVAASAFAAAPVKRPQVHLHAWSAQTCLMSQDLAEEIFLPVPADAATPFEVMFYGVCSVTCEDCYGPGSCPPDPDTGLRQYCAYACN